MIADKPLSEVIATDPAAVEILADMLAHGGPGVKSTNGVYSIARWADFAARVNGHTPQPMRDPEGLAILRTVLGAEYREMLMNFRREVISLLRWLDDVLGLEQTIPRRVK